MNYVKLIIGLLFFLVINRCTSEDTPVSQVLNPPPTPVEINIEATIFPTSGSRSGVLLQPVSFPSSFTQYNFNGDQAAFNHSMIDTIVYDRWNPNEAHFGTFVGSNYTRMTYYKDGHISKDSIITTISYGDHFVRAKPLQPILKDGLKSKIHTWSRSRDTVKALNQYRSDNDTQEYVDQIVWIHTIDSKVKDVRAKPPETCKTRQWQLKHVM